MKTLLLLSIALFTSFQSFAQEGDPDFFGTWYLRAFTADLEDPIYITNESSPVNPTLIIIEDLTFEGLAACNTYTGAYQFDTQIEEYIISDFNPTENDCETESYNSFEDEYFKHFNGFYGDSYNIYIDTNPNTQERYLMVWFAPGFGLEFQETPFLGVPANTLNTFKIYPNPVSKTLFITSVNNSIENISVFSINGQIILSEKENTNQLDVSVLSNGLYFVVVTSENGTAVEKFIKK